MAIDSKTLLQLPVKLKVKGGIAELRRAMKKYRCLRCHGPIGSGEYYYAVFIGGGVNLKFPERAHVDCIKEEV